MNKRECKEFSVIQVFANGCNWKSWPRKFSFWVAALRRCVSHRPPTNMFCILFPTYIWTKNYVRPDLFIIYQFMEVLNNDVWNYQMSFWCSVLIVWKVEDCSRWGIQFRRCNARAVTDVQLVPMSLQLEKIARLGENLLNNISLVLYIVAMRKKAIFSSSENDCKGESSTLGLTFDISRHKREQSWFGRRGMHVRIN